MKTIGDIHDIVVIAIGPLFILDLSDDLKGGPTYGKKSRIGNPWRYPWIVARKGGVVLRPLLFPVIDNYPEPVIQLI
jgi:hypothetical protein